MSGIEEWGPITAGVLAVLGGALGLLKVHRDRAPKKVVKHGTQTTVGSGSSTQVQGDGNNVQK